MHPSFKISLKIFVVCAAIFFLIQPFNWYCHLTRHCQPLYLTYHFPKKEGTETLKAFVSAKSKFRDIDFYADKYEIETVSNRKNIVKFTLRNNSKRLHYVFPKMKITPEKASEYIIKYESPGFQAYRLKPKETLIVNFEFEISDKIESDESDNRMDEEGVNIYFSI